MKKIKLHKYVITAGYNSSHEFIWYAYNFNQALGEFREMFNNYITFIQSIKQIW